MTLETIFNVVQSKTIENIKEDTYRPEVAVMKKMYFLLCNNYTTYSKRRIGELVGRKHANVFLGISAIKDEMETDKNLQSIYKECSIQLDAISEIEEFEKENKNKKLQEMKDDFINQLVDFINN